MQNRERVPASTVVFRICILLVLFIPTVVCALWLGATDIIGYQASAKGFSWSCASAADPNCWLFLNWHPVLMVLAFSSFFSQAILAYKVLPWSHATNKAVHMFFQLLAIISSSLGIYVIWTFKGVTQNANWYTVHSWIGIGAYSFFALQWLLGLMSFYMSKNAPLKKKFLPYHVLVGLCLYLLVTAAIVSGIAGRQWLMQLMNNDNAITSPPFRLAGLTGVFVMVNTFLVLLYHNPRRAKVKTDEMEEPLYDREIQYGARNRLKA